MDINSFRELLKNVDRSYEDFVSLVITFVKMPGNYEKIVQIENYIRENPLANSGDVLQYMIEKLGMLDIPPEKITA